MKKSTAITLIGIVVMICVTALVVVFMLSKSSNTNAERVEQPEISHTPTEPVEDTEEPTTAEKPEQTFEEVLTKTEVPPSEITDADSYDGWAKVYAIDELPEDVSISRDILQYYCDVAGYDITEPEDVAIFNKAASAISTTCGIDVTSAVAADASAFPAVVKKCIPFHIKVDDITYYSFIGNDSIYVYGGLN